MVKVKKTRRAALRRSSRSRSSSRSKQRGGDGENAGAPAANYYEWMGVPRNANTATIRKAYKQLALMTHPNKGGDAETFKLLQQVYEFLTDPEQRAAYDAQLNAEAAAAQNSTSDPGSPTSNYNTASTANTENSTYYNFRKNMFISPELRAALEEEERLAKEYAYQESQRKAQNAATRRVREGTRSAVNRRRAELAAAQEAARRAKAESKRVKTAANWRKEAAEAVRSKGW